MPAAARAATIVSIPSWTCALAVDMKAAWVACAFSMKACALGSGGEGRDCRGRAARRAGRHAAGEHRERLVPTGSCAQLGRREECARGDVGDRAADEPMRHQGLVKERREQHGLVCGVACSRPQGSGRPAQHPGIRLVADLVRDEAEDAVDVIFERARQVCDAGEDKWRAAGGRGCQSWPKVAPEDRRLDSGESRTGDQPAGTRQLEESPAVQLPRANRG